jgi:hypothetical protein
VSAPGPGKFRCRNEAAEAAITSPASGLTLLLGEPSYKLIGILPTGLDRYSRKLFQICGWFAHGVYRQSDAGIGISRFQHQIWMCYAISRREAEGWQAGRAFTFLATLAPSGALEYRSDIA